MFGPRIGAASTRAYSKQAAPQIAPQGQYYAQTVSPGSFSYGSSSAAYGSSSSSSSFAPQAVKPRSSSSSASAPALDRAPSGLTSTLESTKQYKRGDYESVGVHEQCQAVIKEPRPLSKYPDDPSKCWLCSFPIDGLKTLARKLETGITIPSGMLDDYTCEHVLPIKLAYTVATLYQKQRRKITTDSHDSLLHTEYEYAHNLCNYAKSNKYFLTWEDYTPGRDLCSLNINKDKIDEFLNDLYDYTQEGYKRKSFITFHFPERFWPSQPSAFDYTVKNVVQAYLILYTKYSGRDWFADGVEADQKQKWINHAKAGIKNKMRGTLNYIKKADECDGENPGKWSGSIKDRTPGWKHASTQEAASTVTPRRPSFEASNDAARSMLGLSHGVNTEFGHFGTPLYASQDENTAHASGSSGQARGAGSIAMTEEERGRQVILDALHSKRFWKQNEDGPTVVLNDDGSIYRHNTDGKIYLLDSNTLEELGQISKLQSSGFYSTGDGSKITRISETELIKQMPDGRRFYGNQNEDAIYLLNEKGQKIERVVGGVRRRLVSKKRKHTRRRKAGTSKHRRTTRK